MQKIIKTTLFVALALVLVATALLYVSDNQYLLRAFRLTYLQGHRTANIDDYTYFANRTIKMGEAKPWQKHANYNQLSLSPTLRQELEQFDTAAFVVFKDGTLLYEEYWQGRDAKTRSNSFSMAKSIIAMLLFKAIELGKIRSLEQPITDFLPELKDDPYAKKVTLGDLSAMTSGFNWLEDYYYPINPTAKAYFGDDIEQQILKRGFIKPAGGQFEYLSGNTQLLGIVLQRALGHTLSESISQYFWQPLGMTQDALWSLDGNNKMEKAYCCINASARDFGKLGQLLLQQGSWQGQAILSAHSVAQMTRANQAAFKPNEIAYYGHSFWVDEQHQPKFYAMLGHLGQRVIVVPEHNLVIVRLGHRKDQRPLNNGVLSHAGADIYIFINETIKLTDKY